ncbi:pentapeptide repeat-containing protein [Moorena producens JHB]|uniref:Pentapeptide repeat-containing protein n=1 Tax=Moorena producens (strain JHB) TaxID=1454205 RepID=A0A1D9FV69_MOOP1|nr:pentapeptide repeat-containing protein [Moorena producens]AOY79203.1 pentapeptide repeat-containing protein [Moorena producens JHB]
MASKEHLTRLKQGVRIWNDWRANNSRLKLDLSAADLSNLDLSHANLRDAYLSGANFKGANLRGADLSNATLIRTNFSEADLREANFSGASLSRTNFSAANLSEADFSWSSLGRSSLVKACLEGANLRQAYLEEADLSGANFSGANLSGTNLVKAQALSTNFNQAILTGACLENWTINSATQFEEIACDYIYLNFPQRERRPSSGEFAPGEFIKLFQKVSDSIELVFDSGVDWLGFAYSFKKLEVEQENAKLVIQSIENKGNGVVIVRVKISPDADQAKVHNDLMQGYEFAHNLLEKKLEGEVITKDQKNMQYSRDINCLIDLVNKLPIIAKLMAQNY